VRSLTRNEVLEVHRQVMAPSGGADGLLPLSALASALAQPPMTCGGEELDPTRVDKAAALGSTLSKNHPFRGGHKRTGHAAREVFLVLNGHEIRATVDEQEHVILQVAASEIAREEVTTWLRPHLRAKD
jgi:death-on-curing protein